MKQSTSTRWGDLKVGVILIIVIAVLLWVSLTGGGTSIFDPKGEFVCFFGNVEGLLKGSPVWMSGVEIGNVKSVRFVSLDTLRQVEVICRVKKSVWHMITEDSRVQLGTIGFLGDKYVELIPDGAGYGRVIEEGDTVATRDAGSATAMFKEGQQALDNAGDLIGAVRNHLDRINRGEGTLGKIVTRDELYVQMTDLLHNLSMLTASLHDNQERIIGSIEKTSDAISDLSHRVDDNSGTLGKIISDPTLYDNLTATSARLDTIMNRVQAAEGSLGLFVSDTAFYTETINLLTRVNNLVTDIEKNPRKYFKFSVF
ncbi:MAG: MlaD family protein [candidate division Zixibacteria bacterium]|nr:MlaD family protein [candidate division Zixibacteria bacterium]